MAPSNTSEAAETPRLIAALQNGFQNAVIVVAGGMGGIGKAVCDQAAQLGACVIAASRSGAELDKAELPSRGQIATAKLDVTEPASIRAFADWLKTEAGCLDILVNSAGLTRSVPLGELAHLDDALIDLVTAANHTGVLRLVRDLYPLLRAGHAPVIVNISSVAARTGIGSNIAYVGAKAAVDAISVSLAKALAPSIRVVSIAPSALETDFAKGRPQDFFDKTLRATPLKRLASVDEVADAVLCAARLLPMTTGAVITVDGGRSL
ncbi:MAG: SDR family oxidoreductase [Hyphomonadaceae bacterium]|nr:SDR family oxidoreductase [Hyphomonadaceae bacterium]GIK50259.1 MAG: 3-oxoacyl-ACP reductase [Alphaproteobacteria bacterium]